MTEVVAVGGDGAAMRALDFVLRAFGFEHPRIHSLAWLFHGNGPQKTSDDRSNLGNCRCGVLGRGTAPKGFLVDPFALLVCGEIVK